MPHFHTRIFTGDTEAETSQQLTDSLADGSWAVVFGPGGIPAVWITHADVTPGAMQPSYHKMYVTGWVGAGPTGAPA